MLPLEEIITLPDTFTFDVKFFILPSGNRTSEFPFVVFALITDTFDISIILPLFENNLGVMPLDNLTFSKTKRLLYF